MYWGMRQWALLSPNGVFTLAEIEIDKDTHKITIDANGSGFLDDDGSKAHFSNPLQLLCI